MPMCSARVAEEAMKAFPYDVSAGGWHSNATAPLDKYTYKLAGMNTLRYSSPRLLPPLPFSFS
eukprot:scaffold1345_cov223-Pinguiococcus_pyrenoidosus.AAC.6